MTLRRTVGLVAAFVVLGATGCGPGSCQTRLLRCRTRDGHCEQAGPLLHRALLPDTFGF